MIDPRIDRKSMDVLVRSILEKAGIAPPTSNPLSPVDLTRIIEIDQHLKIDWKNLDQINPNLVILAAIDPIDRRIILNTSKNDLFDNKPGALNFSLAHELGHWFLHIDVENHERQPSFWYQDYFICRSDKTNIVEIQANQFAAALLMPIETMKYIANHYLTNKPIEWVELYKIAEALEVSISALVIRLQELRLLYVKDGKVYSKEEEFTGQMELF